MVLYWKCRINVRYPLVGICSESLNPGSIAPHQVWFGPPGLPAGGLQRRHRSVIFDAAFPCAWGLAMKNVCAAATAFSIWLSYKEGGKKDQMKANISKPHSVLVQGFTD